MTTISADWCQIVRVSSTVQEKASLGNGAQDQSTRAVDHLVLVEGPPASGKSTFMQHLALGKLPEEITDLLPREADRWPQSSSNKIHDWLRENIYACHTGNTLPGLVIHHDLMIPLYDGYKHYNENYSATVVELATNITVVSMRARPDVLAKRVAERVCGLPRPSRPSRMLRREKFTQQFWTTLYKSANSFMHFATKIMSTAPRSFWTNLQRLMSSIARRTPPSVKNIRPVAAFREFLLRKYNQASNPNLDPFTEFVASIRQKIAWKCANLPKWQRLQSPTKVIEIYLSRNQLDAWCSQWLDHLNSSIPPETGLKIITISSDKEMNGGDLSWRVISRN